MQELINAPLTPADFAWMTSKNKWYPAKHLLLLDTLLVNVSLGKIKKLMIFMPPRHGKSELTSKYYPAWFIGRNPEKRVILASYEADFAATWGYKARSLFQEFGYEMFGHRISQQSSARDRWDIEGHSGGMQTAGVGGALTGKGADLLIIDDPVKNAEEANSKTYRDKTFDWYRSTAFTRLEPGGSVIIIQTRWNEDDLSGRLLKEEGDSWTVISLPALAEENDVLGRAIGGALFEKRFNVESLLEIKKTLGPYWFNALYQQRPQPDGGSLFKRSFFKYCTKEGTLLDLGDKKTILEHCTIFQTCDPAASKKSTADYFVLGTWARTKDNDLILLDLIRTRLESPDQLNLFWQQYKRWNPVTQYVESIGIGKTLYQLLVREGLPVKELKAESDKVTRALPAAARMEAGTIYFLKNETWLDELEEELISFPNGTHDDQVDVLSYAVQSVIEDKKIQNFDVSMLFPSQKSTFLAKMK